MERLALAAVLVAVAAAAAGVLRRRRPSPPTQSRYRVPAQLDRTDFAGPGRPWLVVVFTSATCDSCRDAVAKAQVLESAAVAYQEVAWQDGKALHDRYAVDVVPLTLMVDDEGVVRNSFIGSTTATDLWAALAAVREGSPPPC